MVEKGRGKIRATGDAGGKTTIVANRRDQVVCCAGRRLWWHFDTLALFVVFPRKASLESGVPNKVGVGHSKGRKHRLGDNRSHASSLYLRVAHDGSVLGRRSEIPAENLPSEIRVPVAEAFGDLSISSATEILEDGQLAYELSSKSEAGGMKISVRADGTVMGYSFRSSLNPPKSR